MSDPSVESPRAPKFRRTIAFLSDTAIMLIMLPLVSVALIIIYAVAVIGEFALQVAALRKRSSGSKSSSDFSDTKAEDHTHEPS